MGITISAVASKRDVARYLTIAALFAVAFVVAFRPFQSGVENDNFSQAIQILLRLWFFFTPAGTLVGLLAGYLVLRSTWLSQAIVQFLRIGRWAPLLLWWVLGVQLTSSFENTLPGTWLWTYGSLTVALTSCYEFVVSLYVMRLSRQDALRRVVRGATIHGLFIALVLEVSIWSSLFFSPELGQSKIGYKVFVAIATGILLINWASRHTFSGAATERAVAVIEELRCEDLNSFLGVSTLFVFVLLLWQSLTGSIFLISPLDILAEVSGVMSNGNFSREAATSLKEIALGMILCAVTAAILVLLTNQFRALTHVFDVLIQTSYLAPIAVLPHMLGFGRIVFDNWSALCAAFFSFYPFARAFLGLRHHRIIPRILLSSDDALPYGAVAIVYGEAMNATAGLGFSMVVAGATRQTARGVAYFVALFFLVTALSAVLRWLARASLRMWSLSTRTD